MPNPKPAPEKQEPAQKAPDQKSPVADPSGHIPPNALHTPTPPQTQPSDPRHYEKIPKLPGDA